MIGVSIDGSSFTYEIKKINDISFVVNEHLYLPDPSKTIKIELGHTIGFNLESNLVNFTLRTYFFYTDMPHNVLGEIHVQNIFEVEDLNGYYQSDNLIVLPPELIVVIFAASIAHSRALFSKNLASSVFRDIILPLSDAVQIAAHFYPNLIKAQQPDPEKSGIKIKSKRKRVPSKKN